MFLNFSVGYAGGSHYSNTGAAAEYLCLPKQPTWGNYSDAHQSTQYLFGAEYQISGSAYFGRSVHDQNVPCAVCRSQKRISVTMVPARQMCFKGWNREYYGYLMSGYAGHTAASEFVCVDHNAMPDTNSTTNEDGKLFYFVEGRCGALPCPPYVNYREITCAVCTK